MSARGILATAGGLLALAVVLGAVGTHVMRARLTPDQLAIYETAVRYHFYHAIGLLGIGAVALTWDSPWLRASAWFMLLGIVLFSGALYLASLGAPRAIQVLPPFGGLAWIVGWIVFAVAAWRR
ncbi:MAG TPA: DUF423 domain-containing protein [Steroidobacteraceae bacterium]|nr:DUF423 domain-containing protein [Steroidobacteraceae bacterium]